MELTVFIIVGAVVLLFIEIALFGKGLTPEDIAGRTTRHSMVVLDTRLAKGS